MLPVGPGRSELRGCCSSRTQYVLYAIRRSRRKGSSNVGAVPCGLASATTMWSSSCGAAPPCSPHGREGLVSSQHRWRRRSIPYASPQRTRHVAATPLNHASLRPLVVKDSFIFSGHVLMSVPSVRAVFRKHPSWRLQLPISSPIGGCSRHCAPRLASCLSRAGPGSKEFPAPTTGRWGSFLWFPRTSRVPPTRDPGPPQVGASTSMPVLCRPRIVSQRDSRGPGNRSSIV